MSTEWVKDYYATVDGMKMEEYLALATDDVNTNVRSKEHF